MVSRSHSRANSPTVKGLLLMLIAGILIIVGQLVCALIALIGLVVGVVGFFKIYRDRYSYHEPHPTNMKYSLIFYILGIAITIVGIIALVVATFSWALAFTVEGTTASEAFDIFLTTLIIAIIIIFMGELCMIAARYKLLIELMPPYLKGFLKGVMVILIIVTIVGLVSVFWLYSELIGTYGSAIDEVAAGSASPEAQMAALESDMVAFQEQAVTIMLVNSVLGIVTHILFILCFYYAWSFQRVGVAFQKERLEGTEITVKRITPPQRSSLLNSNLLIDPFATPDDKIKCPGCGRYMGMGFRKCPDCFAVIPGGVTVG